MQVDFSHGIFCLNVAKLDAVSSAGEDMGAVPSILASSLGNRLSSYLIRRIHRSPTGASDRFAVRNRSTSLAPSSQGGVRRGSGGCFGPSGRAWGHDPRE